MEWKDAFNYGVPTAVLAAFLYGFWKVVIWTRDNVVKPGIENHLELIGTLKEHMPKQTAAIEEQTAEIKGQTRLLQDRTHMFEKIVSNQDKLISTSAKVAETMEEIRKK